MNCKPLWIRLATTGLLAAGGVGLYMLGMHHGRDISGMEPSSAAFLPAKPVASPSGAAGGEEATRRHMQAGLKAGDIDPVMGKKILYYHDPMVPSNKFDKPGKSPFMDMMMSPVYADDEGDQAQVSVSPRIQQNLGVRTAQVMQGQLLPHVSAAGSIAFNERDQAIVQARAAGYVERLHVRATLDRVRKGQALVDLYVPEWIAAQEEFLSVRRMRGTDLAVLAEGARQRMRQVGMSEGQIRLVEQTGRAQPRITLTAPVEGVVVELMAREGMTVMPGATLFRINGLSTVWANAEVPESQSALVRTGARVQARSPAAPDAVFEGKVQAILPQVDAATRTLKARIELANPGTRLTPGMFVQVQFMDMRAEQALLIPSEALIQTGRRMVVIVAEENGRFRSVDVDAGMESGGQTEIKRGLQVGQRVVVSSQFLIDSEASLRGVEARMNGGPADAENGKAAASPQKHAGEAKVESIGKDAITLSHGPIQTMNWGPMTMDFRPPPGGVPSGVRTGDRVTFEFYVDADKLPQLTNVTPEPKPGIPASGSKP